ncbi:metallophosphoesterase [Winogradskyella sp. DF17]|uniref:Metallophosphoesterase n=1 Tax=Winogradskyella pelagia TaxID=2819984 RepID=A0ABS3SYW0_9FLAO|nr:metallophosphoesterase [Winogradskyella sp. DF17]MBO3115672.1 metallophosphoesterase [Winogradskyella sp. DF17]
MTSYRKCSILMLFILVLNACATHKLQVNQESISKYPENKSLQHTFYLIGDAGLAGEEENNAAISAFKDELKNANINSTAIFLGDNIYPKGLPKKNDDSRASAEAQLNAQIDAVKGFKGKKLFIPGNHDWYSDGLDGLKRQEKYIEDALGKNTFQPENGCPIEKIDISDDIVLIVLDSEWYLTNWDNHPKMNDECEIKTRTKFFDEFESDIKKARGKTTIVAIHHPIFSNGPHGGQYSFGSHMSPLPILGTLKNMIRRTGGVVTVDMQNKFYNEFRERIITISQENDKTIFVSGHEHTLQYLVQDNLPQIVSGSGSKTSATRNVGPGKFSYGENGFARLDVFEDGSSHVRFYTANSKDVVYETTVLEADENYRLPQFEPINATEIASVYTQEEVTKGGLYRFFWGERYRKYFGTAVEAPTVRIDTLFGGLKPVRKGGGHQSKSLRLEDNQGRQYVMRALRKNALQYLQAVAFKDQFIEGQFEETYTQDLLLDVFTGSHPYAPFTIATLADAVDVYHTNPLLYYVPKQKALGQFNEDFGDELYMIEEHTSEGHGDKANFGYSNDIISTDDLFKKLNKDEEFVLDEASYIRARLFDMLIGDWDRHEDQWRWAKFKENGQTIYRPVPRDRDQAFSIMSDGALLSFLTGILPNLRLLRSYDAELKSTKWFNLEPYPLDMALINNSGKDVWDQQVQRIVNGLTDDVIEEAFLFVPEEVRDSSIDIIKQKLKGRRANLQDISNRYFDHINKFGIIKGTNKDDWFDIERLPSGGTKVTAYRIKDGEKADIFHQRTYTRDVTKEIWVYGLDDDDVFVVSGEGDSMIRIRLIGGQNKDVYDVRNGTRVRIYDYKSKESEFLTNKGKRKLTDDYDTNIYDYKKLKYSSNQLLPVIGANPDDGLAIGFSNTYTRYGFDRNPFSAQHTVAAGYYFATQGFNFEYTGEIANVIGKLNLGLNAKFTSPNYATNFFGIGNETANPEADEDDGLDVDRDYNRVKLREASFSPSLIWRGRMGAMFKFSLSYESFEVERTEGRFINTIIGDNVSFSDDFYGADAVYTYSNVDNKSFPTLGMSFGIHAGYRNNTETNDGFGYINPELAFDYKLIPSGQLVLASKVKGQINIGDDFRFYQGANLGQNEGLRGFRRERFIGNTAFAQTTDLRLNLRKIKTGLLPLNIGFFGGFDYGRVWADGEDSSIWHTSFGGGIFAEAAEMLSFNLSAFNSDDGLLLAFKLGFGF